MSKFKKIPIDKIRKKIRIREELGNIKQIAKLIAVIGLLNPITVCEEEDGTYTLLSGERRFEACKLLRWGIIDAHVFTCQELSKTD